MATTLIILSDMTYDETKKISTEELLEKNNIIFDSMINTFLEEITRGDLVNIIPKNEYKKNSQWNDFLCEGFTYIIDKKDDKYFLQNLIKINQYIYGLPKNFVLYEEPDYFTQEHWVRDDKCLFAFSNYVLWIKTNKNILENLSIEKGLILTSYIDCRDNFHEIIYKTEKNIDNSFIDYYRNIISKDVFYIYGDLENIDDEILNI